MDDDIAYELIINIMPLTVDKYIYEDCSIGFRCPRCNKSNVADSQDGWEICACGLMYSLSAKIYFKELE